jgi:hypothetical protein
MTVTKSPQTELPLFHVEAKSANVEWFVSFLEGRDWITAAEILALADREGTENEKRKLRALADASGGRIIGHQKGYKLTTTMTHEEYLWWRNEATKAADSIRGRVIETDKVFYSKKAA